MKASLIPRSSSMRAVVVLIASGSFLIVLALVLHIAGTTTTTTNNSSPPPTTSTATSSPTPHEANVAEAQTSTLKPIVVESARVVATPSSDSRCFALAGTRSVPELEAASRPLRAIRDVRSPVILGGKAVSFDDELFTDLDALCSSPPGFASCSTSPMFSPPRHQAAAADDRVGNRTALPPSVLRPKIFVKASADGAQLTPHTSTGAQSLRALRRRVGAGAAGDLRGFQTHPLFAVSSLQDFPTVADLVNASGSLVPMQDGRRRRRYRCVAAGCCCTWRALPSSCTSGLFGNNSNMLRRLALSHFVATPTSRYLPTLRLAAHACPVFDRGTWSLPPDFLDLGLDEAAASSVRASRHRPGAAAAASESSPSPPVDAAEVEFEKLNRANIGPLLVWKLARELRALQPVRCPAMVDASPASATRQQLLVPGMLVISGDSIVRQLFARLVHSVRSRECSDSNEQFRGGVFERYFHVSAGYVVTTRGDALLMGLSGCDALARAPRVFPIVDDDRDNISNKKKAQQRGGAAHKYDAFAFDPDELDAMQTSSAAEAQHGRVLLRVCYVWDNTRDASHAQHGTEFVLSRIAEYPPPRSPPAANGGGVVSAQDEEEILKAMLSSKKKKPAPPPPPPLGDVQNQVAGIIYWPTMHHCNYAGGKCGPANVSNGAALRVFAAALQYSVPRVVVATQIMRHWYPFYATDVIARRNEQLRGFFAVNMWDGGGGDGSGGVARRLDAGIMRPWRLRSRRRQRLAEMLKQQQQGDGGGDADLDEPAAEAVEKTIYGAMGPRGSAGNRLRLFDFAARHANLEPRQCDNGHSSCMFWPLRGEGPVHSPVNGLSGVCPNAGRCSDPWNFVMLHETLALLLA